MLKIYAFALSILLPINLVAEDFSPFPLEMMAPEQFIPAETPTITPGVEYAINPCAYVRVPEGFMCVPTGTGGFIVIPVGQSLNVPGNYLSFSSASKSQSLVTEDQDINKIPPHLRPYVIEIGPDVLDQRASVLSAVRNYTTFTGGGLAPKEMTGLNDEVILPDGTSCFRGEVICVEETTNRWSCTCP